MTIEISTQHIIITDPQRRVYNGCIHSYETNYTPFEVLESEIPKDKIDKRLRFWTNLNDYAVSQRGEGSRNKYRIVEDVLA